ncbi:hypothetical protein [Rugamonas rivuli]|uniref:Uncharacterized protein n=1 Tax=Rugamonas rivuli TaxID=2743358 RepID=A0A843SC19_9BURK|nr:hypothetical protein [Rugamonas rivuli]MQA22055.1 hypothetical protein [Rugamonas rivuli]
MSKESERAAIDADKQRLIREGELYRIKVVHAKALVANALQPDAMFHGAVEQAIGMAQARLGGLLQPGGLKGINFKSLMPYALTVGSYIARKRLVKPAIGVALAAGIGMAWLLRRKPAPEQE